MKFTHSFHEGLDTMLGKLQDQVKGEEKKRRTITPVFAAGQQAEL